MRLSRRSPLLSLAAGVGLLVLAVSAADKTTDNGAKITSTDGQDQTTSSSTTAATSAPDTSTTSGTTHRHQRPLHRIPLRQAQALRRQFLILRNRLRFQPQQAAAPRQILFQHFPELRPTMETLPIILPSPACSKSSLHQFLRPPMHHSCSNLTYLKEQSLLSSALFLVSSPCP